MHRPGVKMEMRYTVTQGTASLQVAAQLHALLQEKAMLASENERLLRENCGLQVRPTPQV